MGQRVVLVQFFPATGNYIVHYQGAGSELFISEDNIHNGAVSQFIKECLEGEFYHESTIHMHTEVLNGKKTVPLRQIIYCKDFCSATSPVVKPQVKADINWVLWIPVNRELTINRGVLGISKVIMMDSLEGAPADVVEFMSNSTAGGVALSHHHCEPDWSDGVVSMKNISEYFFSTGKIIYGFQNSNVSPFTAAEADNIGIKYYGD